MAWRLNLGAGGRFMSEASGWVNYDIRRLPQLTVQGDIRKLPFKDNTFQIVFARDVIEHVSRRHVIPTIQEIWRVLAPRGRAEIITPNLDTIISEYSNKVFDANELVRLLYGQADYEENVHKVGMTPELIADALDYYGFPKEAVTITPRLLGAARHNMMVLLRKGQA